MPDSLLFELLIERRKSPQYVTIKYPRTNNVYGQSLHRSASMLAS
jgi:hypothetical protein